MVFEDWKTYSADELDLQYVVRRRVADWASYLERWELDSAEIRRTRAARLDIPYGPHPAETLDVFLPDKPAAGRPVQVLIHGGYWRALHKDQYSFAAVPGLDAGVTAVVVNYELAPLVTMTELVEQCRHALEWTAMNIDAYGGSSDAIYLSGHSAGGHLVASMLATDWSGRPSAKSMPRPLRFAGACAISGLFDLSPLPHIAMQADLRLTDDEIAELSPLANPIRRQAPVLLTVGAEESAEFHRQTSEYAAHCAASGVAVQTEVVEGCHHYSVVDAFADPAHPLCRRWVAQMTTF